jgi:hypothetical protein
VLLLALLPVATLSDSREPFPLQLADLLSSADAGEAGEADEEPGSAGWKQDGGDSDDFAWLSAFPALHRLAVDACADWCGAEAPPRPNVSGARRATGPPLA